MKKLKSILNVCDYLADNVFEFIEGIDLLLE